jgi:hypothetical protein
MVESGQADLNSSINSEVKVGIVRGQARHPIVPTEWVRALYKGQGRGTSAGVSSYFHGRLIPQECISEHAK